MTKYEFMAWLNTVPKEEQRPFCPWNFSGYCGDAYSMACYDCPDRVDEQMTYYRISKTSLLRLLAQEAKLEAIEETGIDFEEAYADFLYRYQKEVNWDVEPNDDYDFNSVAYTRLYQYDKIEE